MTELSPGQVAAMDQYQAGARAVANELIEVYRGMAVNMGARQALAVVERCASAPDTRERLPTFFAYTIARLAEGHDHCVQPDNRKIDAAVNLWIEAREEAAAHKLRPAIDAMIEGLGLNTRRSA